MTKMATGDATADGSLPHGWRWEPLGQLCQFIRGVSFDKSDATTVAREGCLPVLRAGNIGKRLETADDLVWVPASYVTAEQRLRLGDVIVAMSSGSAQVVGKVARVESEFSGSVGAFCGIIRATEPNHSRYLYHWLCSPSFIAWRDRQARGANIQNLRFSQFALIPIPFPPPDEQRRIVAILDEQMANIEQARRAAVQQLEAARALPAAYLRSALAADESGPWPTVAIGDVCEIVATIVDPTLPQYSQLPHVSAENIVSGEARLLNIRTAEQDGMISGKYTFDAGDVLYSKLRPYLRKVAMAEFHGLCSADMYPLRADGDRVDARFLALVLLSGEFTQYADEESRRTRMPKLNRDQLFRWKMPLPPLDVQRERVGLAGYAFAGARRLESDVRQMASGVDSLPAAQLRRAFSGAL